MLCMLLIIILLQAILQYRVSSDNNKKITYIYDRIIEAEIQSN